MTPTVRDVILVAILVLVILIFLGVGASVR